MTGVGASVLAGSLSGHRAGGERLAGTGIILGTAAGWLWTRGVPNALTPMDWAVAAGVGATLVGALLDGLGARRAVALGLSILAAVALTWGLAVGGGAIADLGPTRGLIAWGVWGLYWPVLLARQGRRTADRGASLAGLAGLMAGVVGVAWAVDAWVARDLTLAALCALGGWTIWTLLARIPFSHTAQLGASGLAVCLAMGLSLTEPAALAGLAVAALAPFAEGTAARLPLPKGRPEALLRPLVHLLFALLPLPLAVAMALVSAGMPVG
jgi:hypothetical protein